MGFSGCVPCGSWGLHPALLGLSWELVGASALVVRHPCKLAAFRFPCAIAFPRSFNKSVLRAFLGGFFGFMVLRCVFGYLVAFVGLVGLYACNVRRLRSEKRNRRYFCGLRSYFLGLLRSCCCFSWFVLWLLCSCSLCWLCGLCCWWFFFPLDDMTKRKGKLLACPIFVGCGLVLFVG